MSLHKLLLVVFLGCIQPISSPMMKRMLGFCCCCAAAGMLATVKVASKANNPRQMFPATLMARSFVDCPRRAGSLRPHRAFGAITSKITFALRLEARRSHAGLVSL